MITGIYKKDRTVTIRLKEDDRGNVLFEYLGHSQVARPLGKNKSGFEITWPNPAWGTATFDFAEDGTSDLIEKGVHRFRRCASFPEEAIIRMAVYLSDINPNNVEVPASSSSSFSSSGSGQPLAILGVFF